MHRAANEMPVPWQVKFMPIIPDSQRLEALRRLGLSEPLILQSAGEQQHPYFWYRCLGPPQLVYQGAGAPDGCLLYPLWDCLDVVTAVWQPGGRLQFIEFNVQTPEEYAVLARSEQGLWARVFDLLHDDYITEQREDFVVPAQIFGFRFLDELWREYERTSHETIEQHERFLTEVVARIDAHTADQP